MRSHLSFDHFAAVLAALGASAAMACGGGTPQPVQANEVTPAAPVGAGQASCSANSCGGKAPSAQAEPAPASASSPPVAAAPAVAAADSTPASTSPATSPATAPAPKTAAASAPGKPAPKTVARKASAPKADAAEASCGAGTCSGDMKKKIL
jgi:hypothetical protein